MATALVLLFAGVEEIEAVTVIDLLRRAGVQVTTAGIGELVVKGSHDISITADKTYRDAIAQAFDAIVLPGGPGTSALLQVQGLQGMLRNYKDAGKVVAAICAAPTILAAAGLLQGRRAACFPACESKMPGVQIAKVPVVEDGNIITSRSAGTAIPFALAVAARLVGKGKADEVARSILHESRPDTAGVR